MLKKILIILLCSTSVLVANQVQEIQLDNIDGEELSPTEKKVAYFWMAVGTLGISVAIGEMAVAALPKKAPYVVKVATFIPAALVGFMASIVADKKVNMGDMLDYYKKHKRRLYIPGILMVTACAISFLKP